MKIMIMFKPGSILAYNNNTIYLILDVSQDKLGEFILKHFGGQPGLMPKIYSSYMRSSGWKHLI